METKHKFEDYLEEAGIIAKKVKRKFGSYFEVDEMIAEAWIEFKLARDPSLRALIREVI